MVDAGTGIAIFYLVIGSIVTALITAWLTYMYARPGTSIWVLLSTFFSWYLTFATFFYLLPVDLYYVAQDFYRPVWGFVYWVSFTLTWVFLPVQQTYAEAGEFTFGARLWAAIRFNTIFYVIAGVIVGGFLIYIAVQNQFGSDQVVGLIVMLANTWGLTLAVISLGYGLVEVPRSLWNNANRQVRLNRVRWLASNVSAELADARDQVAYALKLVRIAQQKVPANDPLAPYLAEVEGNLPQNQTVDTTTRARIVDIEDTKLKKQLEEGPMTIRLLADLNYFVKQTTRTLSLSEDHWAELLDKEEFLQQLVAAANGEAVIGREGWRGKLWNIRVFSGPLIGRTLAVIFALVSIILVWGELVLYHPELSPFAQLLNALKGTGGAVFFATCILSYQTMCAVYALFAFRVMKFYHMHFNRRTDENSILFNAALLLRLIGPMGYNFLQLTNMAEDGGTVFVDVVGKMDHVPFFGTSLPVYLPILISVFCFGSLFHVYGRIMRILGVKRFDYSASAMTDDVVQEGASLLAKARRRKEHEKNIASRPSVSAAAAAIRAPRASKFGISDNSRYSLISSARHNLEDDGL